MIIASFYWDPPREVFRLPVLDIAIVWYGIIFATGFALAYYIHLHFLRRFLLSYPSFTEGMILDEDLLLMQLKEPSKKEKNIIEMILSKGNLLRHFSNEKVVGRLNELLEDRSFYESFSSLFQRRFYANILSYPNVLDPKKAQVRLLLGRVLSPSILTVKQLAAKITDRVTGYIIIATIIGARLGHLFFYEKPSYYLSNPLIILQVWKGGLSSHGGVIAIFIALLFYAKWVRRYNRELIWISILDLLTIPAAFVASCIRVGNFFNQEVLGTPTDLPWAVSFGHPFDGSMPGVPRHPVQLYEALFYFGLFLFFYLLASRGKWLYKRGKMIALFFIATFGFRFVIEFLKERQSAILDSAPFSMGQYLSLPIIFLGLVLFFYPRKRA